MNETVRVVLKEGHEAPAIHGHPWVFSRAIGAVEGATGGIAVAGVVTARGRWVGRGLFHPQAALAVRLYTRQQDQALDDAFFAGRAAEAARSRRDLFDENRTNAFRVVFSESDGLSGVVIDRYADVLSVQVDAKGLLPYLRGILGAVAGVFASSRIVVRPEEGAGRREGLTPEELQPFNSGTAGPIRIRENGLSFDVDMAGGQKTGFFLDQRENRMRVAAYAKGRRVLSAYCYTGAFEVCVAAAGAREIVGLDSSEPALDAARRHHELNGLTVPVTYRKADVPTALRSFRDARETFEMVILDPPRFVANRAQKEKGMRAYKDIALLGMKLLAPGGILATFSCSGLIGPEDFRKVIGWAAADSGRAVRILETLGQPADHPVLAVFPESEYLKGAICRVD